VICFYCFNKNFQRHQTVSLSPLSQRFNISKISYFTTFSLFEKMNKLNIKRAIILASAVLAAGAGGVWFYTW